MEACCSRPLLVKGEQTALGIVAGLIYRALPPSLPPVPCPEAQRRGEGGGTGISRGAKASTDLTDPLGPRGLPKTQNVTYATVMGTQGTEEMTT